MKPLKHNWTQSCIFSFHFHPKDYRLCISILIYLFSCCVSSPQAEANHRSRKHISLHMCALVCAWKRDICQVLLPRGLTGFGARPHTSLSDSNRRAEIIAVPAKAFDLSKCIPVRSHCFIDPWQASFCSPAEGALRELCSLEHDQPDVDGTEVGTG